MSIENYKVTFRRMLETAMDKGEVRDVPGSVVTKIDLFATLLIKRVEDAKTFRERKSALEALIGASIAEEELTRELRGSDESG